MIVTDISRRLRVAIACHAMLLLSGLPTSAQTTPSAVPDQAAPESAPDNPGLINELSKLIKNPVDLFPSLKLSPDTAAPSAAPRQPGDTVGRTPPPAAALPEASSAPAKPPAPALVPQVISGRAPCPVAANGAPDCRAGAAQLCQTRGYGGGRSLDTDSAHICSTKAVLSGARTLKDICKTQTFVIRAMCQ